MSVDRDDDGVDLAGRDRAPEVVDRGERRRGHGALLARFHQRGAQRRDLVRFEPVPRHVLLDRSVPLADLGERVLHRRGVGGEVRADHLGVVHRPTCVEAASIAGIASELRA